MIRKLKNIAHWGLAILANIRYGFPGRKITVIGVTGTDGKTTTTSMIYHILNALGQKTAMVTTVGAYLDGQVHSTGFHVTTPSAFAIQRFLRDALKSGHKYAVVETSSHGIDQNRIWGIKYAVVAITNITHEHLDYHKTFYAYAETKFKLLKQADVAVINLDDISVANFKSRLTNKVITYSLNQSADFNLNNTTLQTQLFGSFNQLNALAATASCVALGYDKTQVTEAIKTFKAPSGRQDIIWTNSFNVMVDFAHTPNAVETILKEVRNTHPKRVIHMFGAPGRRDESKRPLMGQASSNYADVIVVVPDDPRDEVISTVNNQIVKGITSNFELGKNLFVFEDRLKGLEFTLKFAQAGDFVVLTGKGHEETLAMADGERPWNEKALALDILNNLSK